MAKLNTITLLLVLSVMMSSCWRKPVPVAQQIKKGQQEDVSKLTTPNDTISPRCVHVGRPAHVFLPARHRSASKVDTLY